MGGRRNSYDYEDEESMIDPNDASLGLDSTGVARMIDLARAPIFAEAQDNAQELVVKVYYEESPGNPQYMETVSATVTVDDLILRYKRPGRYKLILTDAKGAVQGPPENIVVSPDSPVLRAAQEAKHEPVQGSMPAAGFGGMNQLLQFLQAQQADDNERRRRVDEAMVAAAAERQQVSALLAQQAAAQSEMMVDKFQRSEENRMNLLLAQMTAMQNQQAQMFALQTERMLAQAQQDRDRMAQELQREQLAYEQRLERERLAMERERMASEARIAQDAARSERELARIEAYNEQRANNDRETFERMLSLERAQRNADAKSIFAHMDLTKIRAAAEQFGVSFDDMLPRVALGVATMLGIKSSEGGGGGAGWKDLLLEVVRVGGPALAGMATRMTEEEDDEYEEESKPQPQPAPVSPMPQIPMQQAWQTPQIPMQAWQQPAVVAGPWGQHVIGQHIMQPAQPFVPQQPPPQQPPPQPQPPQQLPADTVYDPDTAEYVSSATYAARLVSRFVQRTQTTTEDQWTVILLGFAPHLDILRTFFAQFPTPDAALMSVGASEEHAHRIVLAVRPFLENMEAR